MSDKSEKKGLAHRCIRTMVKSGMKGRDALKAAVALSEKDDVREADLKGDKPDNNRGKKRKWNER